MSSRQKMKERYEAQIQELKKDIAILVSDEHSIEAEAVKMLWRHQIDSDNNILYGSSIYWSQLRCSVCGETPSVIYRSPSGILACIKHANM